MDAFIGAFDARQDAKLVRMGNQAPAMQMLGDGLNALPAFYLEYGLLSVGGSRPIGVQYQIEVKPKTNQQHGKTDGGYDYLVFFDIHDIYGMVKCLCLSK